MTERLYGATTLLAFDVAERRRAAGICVPSDEKTTVAPFAALANGLSRELEPLSHARLLVPSRKARLTRIGGRCPVHGTLLEFNPFAPHDHRCVQCNRAWGGVEHDEWWAMGAHLWTAERAVHAAALHALRGEPQHGVLARRILATYAEQYDRWPNRDNVLGPTRLFFSTYLESIWLLNCCHAVALLDAADKAWSGSERADFCANVIAPSANLIAGYHEGRSNRQVWNEVAILSAWRVLGDTQALRKRLHGEGGLLSLMHTGLLADGTWYEGENYHLFAHRGLWYGVELMRCLGEPLPPTLNARYAEGFVTPFLGLLPDDTFPSRRDSQYASSMHQWRTAEWCELGWAHSSDPRLAGILSRMYDDPYDERYDERYDEHRKRRHALGVSRAHSTADAERNGPAQQLSRASLSWRALLMATPVAPPTTAWHLESVVLPHQGLAVLRRDEGRVYVALEGGELGGGHGHPDQLALTVQTGDFRWLEDPGTGSYVSPDLFWYRSTMAHAAPWVNDASQEPAVSDLLAFGEDDAFGWTRKRTDGISDGMRMIRTVVVADAYVVDVLQWTTVDEAETITVPTVSLPIAGAATVADEPIPHWTPDAQLSDSDLGSAPHPFAFMLQQARMPLLGTVHLRATPTTAHALPRDEHDVVPDRAMPGSGSPAPLTASLWYAASAPAWLVRAEVPGAPGHPRTWQHRVECHAREGCIVGVRGLPARIESNEVVAEVAEVMLAFVGQHAPRVGVRQQIRGPDRAERTVVHTHTTQMDTWHVHIGDGVAVRDVVLHVLPEAQSRDAPARQRRFFAPVRVPQHSIRVPSLPLAALRGSAGETIAGSTRLALGAEHYIRTEEPWHRAGAPTAFVQFGATADVLVVDVRAHTGVLVVRDVERDNPLDNERSAINGDGIQWYFAAIAEDFENPVETTSRASGRDTGALSKWASSGLFVPSLAHGSQGYSVPLQPLTAMPPTVMPATAWREWPDGWAVRLEWPWHALPVNAERSLAFELVINECPPERERRRGQLALGGGGGFGYLAGDRRPVERARVLRWEP